MISLLLMALTGYFSWLLGRRYERGRIEIAELRHRELFASGQQRRSGGIRLNTMKIRR